LSRQSYGLEWENYFVYEKLFVWQSRMTINRPTAFEHTVSVYYSLEFGLYTIGENSY
jgi:hypothetical protein